MNQKHLAKFRNQISKTEATMDKAHHELVELAALALAVEPSMTAALARPSMNLNQVIQDIEFMTRKYKDA